MKPPPRKRTKIDRTLYPEPASGKQASSSSQWKQAEQRSLLTALKKLSGKTQGHEDIDYDFLRNHVQTRSISEMQSVVEYLKNKVISMASQTLKEKRLEEKVRKPIEVWTHMASTITGNLEEPISTAFSQMLIVSSTEPCTLRNCDPPQVYRPPTNKDGPVGRTITPRPMTRLPVKAERPNTNTARPLMVIKTPAPAMGPAKRLPAPSQVVRVPNSNILPPKQRLPATAGSSPAVATSTSQSAASVCQPGAAATLVMPSTSPQPSSQTVTPLTVTGQVPPSSGSAAVVKTPSVGSSLIRTTQQPAEQHPTPISTATTSNSLSSSNATSQTPVPSTAASTGASSTPPLSTTAAALYARFGRTSKYNTTDTPRVLGVKSVVDFERIYCYLSQIHQPNDECHLTPMESAIMLDLLMSLPEELRLLNCNKLHTHLTQVYQFLSSPADSKMAREMFKERKDGLRAQTGTPSGPNGQQNTAGAADSDSVTDSGGKKLQPEESESQSSGSSNPSGHSGNAEKIGLCPPLNPFMVPLKLLRRK
ncbi:snRNA-activating protein complex subunit 2 isoform X2 [Sander lucioperca]|uniref:snRNA-activating protein complex subunit 2 isoform X2 n=1 Tax=Sander lucioperca TaxID=283035 RepID=UPI0016538B93|nr:snRNA-activating protein complex subunit 2 isoform X2 [Sander lucioperca]